jgi:hypothetical protein
MAGIVKNGREKTDLFAASHLVRFWHKADIGRSGLLPCKPIPEPHFAGRKSLL